MKRVKDGSLDGGKEEEGGDNNTQQQNEEKRITRENAADVHTQDQLAAAGAFTMETLKSCIFKPLNSRAKGEFIVSLLDNDDQPVNYTVTINHEVGICRCTCPDYIKTPWPC